MDEYKDLIYRLRAAAYLARSNGDKAPVEEDAIKVIECLVQENNFLKAMQRQLTENMDARTLGRMVDKSFRGP